MSKNIDRILKANWPGHMRVEADRFEKRVNKITSKAFPGLLPKIEVIPIRSRFRNWQVVESDEKTYHIIADLEYTDLLYQIDIIIRNKVDPGIGFQEIYTTALKGWVYLFTKDYRRALVLLGNAYEERQWLSEFQDAINEQKDQSITSQFVLLHELSHFIVDNKIKYGQKWDDFVSGRFKASIEATKSLYNGLAKGESEVVIDGYTISDFPEDQADRDLLTLNVAKFLEKIENDPEIKREIMCDVIALIGLLSVETEYDILNKGIPLKTNKTIKEIGECIVIGYRTLKAMQVIGMLKSEAQDIKNHKTTQGIHYDLILQTMRHNMMGDICGLMLKLFYSSADFENDSGNSHVVMDNILRKTLNTIQRHSMDRLVIPCDNINALMRDERMLRNAEREIKENLNIMSLDELELQLYIQKIYRELPI